MGVVQCDGESNPTHCNQQVNFGSSNFANGKDAELGQTDQQVTYSSPISNSEVIDYIQCVVNLRIKEEFVVYKGLWV